MQVGVIFPKLGREIKHDFEVIWTDIFGKKHVARQPAARAYTQPASTGRGSAPSSTLPTRGIPVGAMAEAELAEIEREETALLHRRGEVAENYAEQDEAEDAALRARARRDGLSVAETLREQNALIDLMVLARSYRFAGFGASTFSFFLREFRTLFVSGRWWLRPRRLVLRTSLRELLDILCQPSLRRAFHEAHLVWSMRRLSPRIHYLSQLGV